jgi:hydrogenase maturation factor HypE
MNFEGYVRSLAKAESEENIRKILEDNGRIIQEEENILKEVTHLITKVKKSILRKQKEDEEINTALIQIKERQRQLNLKVGKALSNL